MSMDWLTAGAGITSFIIFFIIHIITFRWVAPEALLKSLGLCVVAIVVLPVGLVGILYYLKAADAPLAGWILAAVLALVINGFLSLAYVMCIFGPYETSVRMRLVREIAAGGSRGLSMEELLSRYSAETIMTIRLRRLVGSGDVIEKEGRFHCGRSENFFFMFDAVAKVIKKWIGR